jgi:hypothetical protein
MKQLMILVKTLKNILELKNDYRMDFSSVTINRTICVWLATRR